MIPQAEDFRAESQALYELIRPIEPARYREPTQFKGWTIDNVLQHLHFWNRMAHLALTEEAEFQRLLQALIDSGLGMPHFEQSQMEGLDGPALLEEWHAYVQQVADTFAATDPKKRLKWAGPDMSARSSITARLMETWAHGQEVYDHLGVERQNTDRIRNIAHLGVNTFGFSFAIHGREVPGEPPHVRLTAPSGDTWEWHSPDENNLVSGDAVEFCQVVTQSRNVAETGLTVVGDVAREWMAIAQCFAGGAETPPPPGTRFTRQPEQG